MGDMADYYRMQELDVEIEYEFYIEVVERAENIKAELDELSNEYFLNEILKKKNSVAELNGVTKKFPAGDIALKYKNNDWCLSNKQREAITNCYVYLKTNINPRRIK